MRFCQQKLRFNLPLFILLLSFFPWTTSLAQTDKTHIIKHGYEYEYEEPYDYRPSTTVAKVFDVVIARPVMIGVSIFSFAGFVGSLPFTATGAADVDVSTARETLVSYPLNYTFTRPLGDFSEQ